MVWRTLDPFAELVEMRQRFDRVLDRARGDERWSGGRAVPALNVSEDGDQLHVEAELPGLKAEDLDITVSGNELTLKGGRKTADDEAATYHRRERPSAEFSRTITLPYEIDQEKVEARMQDGVLALTLRKAPRLKPCKIEVKPG